MKTIGDKAAIPKVRTPHRTPCIAARLTGCARDKLPAYSSTNGRVPIDQGKAGSTTGRCGD